MTNFKKCPKPWKSFLHFYGMSKNWTYPFFVKDYIGIPKFYYLFNELVYRVYWMYVFGLTRKSVNHGIRFNGFIET